MECCVSDGLLCAGAVEARLEEVPDLYGKGVEESGVHDRVVTIARQEARQIEPALVYDMLVVVEAAAAVGALNSDAAEAGTDADVIATAPHQPVPAVFGKLPTTNKPTSKVEVGSEGTGYESSWTANRQPIAVSVEECHIIVHASLLVW